MKKLNAAKVAMIAKNYQEASKNVEEVLVTRPGHKRALILKKEIAAKAGF